MKREHKKSISKKSGRRLTNQLSLDFNQNVPIEIHIPRISTINFNKEILWNKKTVIELVKG